MKRAPRCCLALAVCSVAAAPAFGASEARRATLPLIYTSCADAPGDPLDPTRIAIRDTPKGPVVDFDRAGLPRQTTRDANLAFVSRRLFFTLKVGDTLIEFQGRATDHALEGTLSDERGAHGIVLPASHGVQRCGKGA